MILRRVQGLPTWDWRSPFEELEEMRRQMGRLSQDVTGTIYTEPTAGVFPLVNVTEDKDNYYIRAELPGIKADEIDISVTGNDLSISGERKIHAENENANYHRRERDEGQFSRIICLPAEIDPANVEAQTSDGILTVVLAKSESAKPRQIAVKTS